MAMHVLELAASKKDKHIRTRVPLRNFTRIPHTQALAGILQGSLTCLYNSQYRFTAVEVSCFFATRRQEALESKSALHRYHQYRLLFFSTVSINRLFHRRFDASDQILAPTQTNDCLQRPWTCPPSPTFIRKSSIRFWYTLATILHPTLRDPLLTSSDIDPFC